VWENVQQNRHIIAAWLAIRLKLFCKWVVKKHLKYSDYRLHYEWQAPLDYLGFSQGRGSSDGDDGGISLGSQGYQVSTQTWGLREPYYSRCHGGHVATVELLIANPNIDPNIILLTIEPYMYFNIHLLGYLACEGSSLS
jgi:hypothetical protein